MNLIGQKPKSLHLIGHIYVTNISHATSMYSHSGATLSNMLECLVNFIAKCKLREFAIGFCHSKKMYNVTIFFCDRTNVRSKFLLLGHLPNLVGHCPMSDSNFQPCFHCTSSLMFVKYLHSRFFDQRKQKNLPLAYSISYNHLATRIDQSSFMVSQSAATCMVRHSTTL